MKLITAHKILISFAIAFFLFFGVRQLLVANDTTSVVIAIFSLGISVGLCAYLRWVFRTNPSDNPREVPHL